MEGGGSLLVGGSLTTGVEVTKSPLPRPPLPEEEAGVGTET